MPRKKIVPDVAVVDAVETVETVQPIVEEVSAPAKRKPAKPALTPDTYVTVQNGFAGKLVYKSSHTGERFVWDNFGAEQDMTLQELKNARNSYKSYFENNWFLFNDPDVIEYLGVQRYYDNSMVFSEFDSVFTLPPEKLSERLSKMPVGQKNSLKYRAARLIAEGKIDSLGVIRALESGLGVSLMAQ